MKKVVVLAVFLLLFGHLSAANAENFGMYVKVAENVEGSFENAVKNIEDALNKNGWQILASYKASVPDGCGFRAHNIVAHSSKYAAQIASNGSSASFALPLRISIFENEKGINTAFVNPASLNRTVLGDKVAREASISTMNKLSEILASAAKGKIVNAQIGEVRSSGRVGGMGGGNFNDKIVEIYKKKDSGNTFQEIAQKVKDGILSAKKGWKLIYSLDLNESSVIIYGVNKAEMESRAYKIAGEKRESKNNRCPGIDHVSAFPIEVIIYKESGMVKVVTLDEMYRMKVYFEDAGMWAFMKNMKMPGEIKGEIVEISSSLLKN
ncbi:MAG: hypothetical protein AB1632_09670 [Nitrospirota bacterium]